MSIDKIRKEGQVLSLPFAIFSPTRLARLAAIPLVIVGLALWAPAAHAQTPPGSYDEEEAQAIDQMLMCPVCPAESIDQAQVPLAKQMRQRVRELLAEGATRQEVLDYFADRYGQSVLASPPKSGFNLLAWALPIAGLLAALVAVLLALRAMKGRSDRAEVEAIQAENGEENLQEYLAAVDRSLAIDGEEGKAGGE